MKSIRIGAALKAGWRQFMKRPWYLLGLTLSVFVLACMAAGNSVGTALSYILYGGYIALLIKHFEGTTVEFDDLFSLDSRWINFAFLGLVKTAFIILGLVCFIVPGVYLIIRWYFAEMIVIDQGLRPMAALKASSELTKGVRLDLFFFVLLGVLLVVVSALGLLIGAVAAVVVLSFASIKLYFDLKEQVAATAVASEAKADETLETESAAV